MEGVNAATTGVLLGALYPVRMTEHRLAAPLLTAEGMRRRGRVGGSDTLEGKPHCGPGTTDRYLDRAPAPVCAAGRQTTGGPQ